MEQRDEKGRQDSGLILAVDGGGSKTTALIATMDGTVLAQASAGASNYHGVGAAGTRAAFAAAIGQAVAAAGREAVRFAVAFFGLAGVDRAEDRRVIEAIIEEIPWRFDHILIDNDARIALAAATLGQPGLVVICGTGSIALGIDAAGRRVRAGGWGAVLGDEGSGHDMGVQALRAVARAADGRGEPTQLSAAVLSALQLEEPQQLISYVYERPISRSEVAALARLVFAAAEEGDRVATAIIEAAVAELVLLARTVLERLDLRQQPIRIGLTGGGFQNDTLRRLFRQRLQPLAPQAEIVLSALEPAAGGLILALQQHYAAAVPETVLQRLLDSLMLI